MKVYHSRADKPKKKLGKNAIISLSVCGVLVLAAVGLTLGLTLPGKPDPGPNNPVDNNPVVYVMPVGEFTLGQGFCIDKLVYSATLNQWRTHNGIDFKAEKGSEVKAIYDGTVKSVQQTTLEGTVITIDHGNGLIATYKGLGETKVEENAKVKAGDVIGVIDSMMTEAQEGSHLHLETTLNGKLVDPMNYLPTENSDK